MFCSSLCRRPEWSIIRPMLLSQQQPKWQESTLDNHDIAIPLPSPDGRRDEPEKFRLIFISASEVGSSEAMERIERFYHQHGGSFVGIIFLLTPNRAGTVAFMNLQLSLLPRTDMPILPLCNLASLPTVLSAFQRQLVASSRSLSSMPKLNLVSVLLPYCSLNPPIPEHARNIITDICPNIAVLAQAATTVDGQQGLRDYLSDVPSATGDVSIVDDLIAFWEQEIIVD